MNSSILFSLDLSLARQGAPLMTGDIGYDEYAGTLSTLGYANLSLLKDAPPGTFRYIRIHNIFTSKEGDLRGARDAGGDPVRIRLDGSYYYDWTILDLVLQAILDVGCVPFLELGFTPTPWSTIKTRFQFLKSKMFKVPGSYPPKDNMLWDDLVHEFCKHLLSKFGESVYHWPCELWNEPDIVYFRGSVKKYCGLWKNTYHILKDNGMKIVGGPGVAVSGIFLRAFLKYSIENSCVPDFISYHVKGGGGQPKKADFDKIYSSLLSNFRQIPEDLKSKPIWITEYDPIVGCEKGIPDNKKWAFRNTSFYASWLGKSCVVFALLQQGLKWGYEKEDHTIAFDVQAIFNDGHHITAEQSPFFGSRCLTTPIWVELSTNVKESTYNPLEVLKKTINLETEQPSLYTMQKDLDSRMYKPANPEKFILKCLPKPIFRAFEYVRFLKGKYIPFYNAERNLYGIIALDGNFLNICLGIHDDGKLLKNNQFCETSLEIRSIRAKDFEIQTSIRIDSESCNPYETWLEMGSPYEITQTKWDLLKGSTLPNSALISNIEMTEGTLVLDIKLAGNCLNFVRLLLKK